MALRLFCCTFTVCAAMTYAAERVAAELLAYDGFDYPAGVSLAGQSGEGSFGFSQGWVLGGPATPHHVTASSGLSDPTGALLTRGNHATVPQVSPSGVTTARRNLGEVIGTSGTRRYVSFLLRPEGTLGVGEFGGYFGLELVSAGSTLFTGKPTANQYVLEHVGGAGQVSTSAVPSVGETVLLVVRADFEDGSDTFRLYVNPIPGHPEPAIPDAIKSDLDVGTVTAIGTFSSGMFSFDELRLGETFSDVVPITEPATWVISFLGLLLGSALIHARRTITGSPR